MRSYSSHSQCIATQSYLETAELQGIPEVLAPEIVEKVLATLQHNELGFVNRTQFQIWLVRVGNDRGETSNCRNSLPFSFSFLLFSSLLFSFLLAPTRYLASTDSIAATALVDRTFFARLLYEHALTKAKSPQDASAGDEQAENEDEGALHNEWDILGNSGNTLSSFSRHSIRRRSTANGMRRKVCPFYLCALALGTFAC